MNTNQQEWNFGGRARHSVRAVFWLAGNGAQRTDAPYHDGFGPFGVFPNRSQL
ncbi:MAG TPA: hypothetical protein PKA41_19205 [Verrucomicrobiota bacterium]|nr:hypothetical protein [Verrucomicrobiota bacterium]